MPRSTLMNELQNREIEFGLDYSERLTGENRRVELKKTALTQSVVRNYKHQIPTFLDFHDETSQQLALESNDIKNVDSEDSRSPLHLHKFVSDIYRYLRWKETHFILEESFLSKKKVTPKNRSTLIDWLINVHRTFKLLPETLHLTIRLLDTYCNEANPPNKILQLIGVTCLWIACKFEEIYVPNTDDILYLTENAFDLHELCECERSITMTLQFDLNPPTSLAFLKRAAKVSHINSKPYNLAKYILELTFLEYPLTHYFPSLQAAAALYLSLIIYNKIQKDKNPNLNRGSNVWSKESVFYTGYHSTDLEDVAAKMAQMLENRCSAAEKCHVFKKYRNQNLESVSSLPINLQAVSVYREHKKLYSELNVQDKLDELPLNSENKVTVQMEYMNIR